MYVVEGRCPSTLKAFEMAALITLDQRDLQPLVGATAMGERDFVYRLTSRTQ